MRPAGELRAAARSLIPPAPAPGQTATGVSYLGVAEQLAQRGMLSLEAPSEVALVRCTMKNMVQAGELQRVGEERRPGRRRSLARYVSAQGWDARSDAGAALQAAWRVAA